MDLGFDPEGKFFNDRIGQHFPCYSFHLGLGSALVDTLFEGEQKILPLPDIPDAAVFHAPQRIGHCLPLGIQHGSFQRDIDMSLHSV